MTGPPEGEENLHASCVAFGAAGILLLGPSGSGKSSTALRLVAAGADLVADDRVLIRREGEGLTARPPAAIAGLVEARGVGLIALPHRSAAPLALAVDLAAEEPERLPPQRFLPLLGRRLPLLLGRGNPDLATVLTVWFRLGGVRRETGL